MCVRRELSDEYYSAANFGWIVSNRSWLHKASPFYHVQNLTAEQTHTVTNGYDGIVGGALGIVRPENGLKLFSYCTGINNGKPMCWAEVADKVFMRRFSNFHCDATSNVPFPFHPLAVCVCLICAHVRPHRNCSLTLCDSKMLCFDFRTYTQHSKARSHCSWWQMIDFMVRRQYRLPSIDNLCV